VQSLDDPYPDVRALIDLYGNPLPGDALNGETWRLTDAETAGFLRTMEVESVRLGEYVDNRIYYGIKTGFNEAFVIDSAKRAELIAADPKSAEIIKPLAVGDDVRKWRIENRGRWLIVTPIGINIRQYPAVFAHLQRWQRELEARWDKGNYWWELRSCDYYDAFDKPKIMFPDIARESRFTLDTTGIYTTNTTYFIACGEKYLLGVLNSSTIWRYAKESLTVLGDAERGGRLRFFTQFVERLPIPNAPATERAAIADLVQKCLDACGVDCAAWEAEINERVARLYGV